MRIFNEEYDEFVTQRVLGTAKITNNIELRCDRL